MAADRPRPRKLAILALLCASLAMPLSSCAASRPDLPPKVALLAPFEGRYREIGYNALYAMRLAFGDAAPHDAQLLAVDDGGAVESAVARVRALNLDPAVAAIIALGPAATHSRAQMANDKPMLIIGNWGHERADSDSLYVASRTLAEARSQGDLLMLAQTAALHDNLGTVHFVSSGAPPDGEFRRRYLESALYAPPPNLLATLTYDCARLALAALHAGEAIGDARYHGVNGEIRFEEGYWRAAPAHRYRYQGGQLVSADG